MKYKIWLIMLVLLMVVSIPVTTFARKITQGTDYEIQTGGNSSKGSSSHTIDEIIQEGQNFLNAGKEEMNNGNAQTMPTINEGSLKEMSDTIYNILLGIGIVVAVAVGAYLGIQFMVSSVENKAKVKESLIIFVIGCCIVFGAFGIWKVVINVMSSMETSTVIQ